MHPDATDVAEFLGRGGDSNVVALAGAHLPIVTNMIRAYTRDQGFDKASNFTPDDDIESVIVSATARLVNNPELNTSVDLGTFSIRPGQFDGWTLPELAILNRHRKRAA